MLSWRTSSSSPKFFLLCGRHRLKAAMWSVPIQRSFRIVSVPSGKLTGWLARLWFSTRRIENPPARQWRHPRRRLLDLQSLTAWGPRPPRLRGLWHRSRPFELAPEGPVHDHSREARSLARLLHLHLPDNVDGSQVEARLAGFAPHWRSLLGNCRATGIVEDGVGIAFQQRPQLTHQSISFRTRNSRQDLQQAVDVTCWWREPSRGSTTWQDFCDAYLHVPMHQAVRKYLRFVVNKKVYQFTCLPCGLATYPREFTKLLRTAVSLFRQQGVKLHVYLDDWLIRADTPEQALLHAQTTFRVLLFLARSSTSRSSISLQVKTSSSLGCSSTLDVSQVASYRRCV